MRSRSRIIVGAEIVGRRSCSWGDRNLLRSAQPQHPSSRGDRRL